MESDVPACPVKSRLVQEYFEATQVYTVAIAEFNRRLADATIEDYSKLNRLVDRTRRQSEDARDRLSRHIAEHHC